MSTGGFHRTIAFKLHCAAGLALVALLALSAVSVHFASRTKAAAAMLAADGIRGRAVAARLELLLQTHRGIVESAPAELDRDRLSEARARLQDVGAQLADEIAKASAMGSVEDLSLKLLARQVGQEMPELVSAGSQTLDLAYNFVQDGALEVAQGPYATAAGRLQQQLRTWRDERARILDEQVALLSASAETLTSRVLGCSVAVLGLGGLAGVTARRVLGRLEGIKLAMLRLADHDTAVKLPCLASADEIGAVARAVQSFKDNAIRVGTQDTALKQAARQLEAALGNMSQGLCLYNAQNELQVVNERFSEIYGLNPELLRPGLSFRDVIQISIDAGNHAGRTADDIVRSRLEGKPRAAGEIVLQELGTGRIVAISQRPVQDGGWVATYEDVTARRAVEERVLFLAGHDALTNLPNRVKLNDRLIQAVAGAERGIASAILCIDLDRFKVVNDTLGHPVGDTLLVAVAGRLMALARAEDVVARLGGDEFAIVQAGIGRPEEAKLMAERVINAIAAPFQIDGHQIVIGATVGIALTPGDGLDPDRLMRNADMALYRAKSDGRGTFCFFEPGMDARLQTRRQMESDLRSALALSQFELFYQPLVQLASGEVSGFEALIRWRHPVRGLVSPADFIPIVEEIGLIVPVGEWVIETACAQAALWPGAVKVAVNLSPVQFKSPRLYSVVRDALAVSGLPPRRLELEITESVLLQDTEATMTTLHQLRSLGARIAMDDFGTGYSSLSYLRSFPFDKVKIDQSFIRDLSTREDSIFVIRAVTGLCAGLGMATTAEGVETLEQLHKLQGEGCTEVQGYLFSRPRPADEVLGLIASIHAPSENDLVAAA